MVDEHSAALHIACFAAPATASHDEQLRLGTEALDRVVAQGAPYVDGAHGRAFAGDELRNFCRAVGDPAWRGMVTEFRRMIGLHEPAMLRRSRGEESRARFVFRHRRRWYFHDRAVGTRVRLGFLLPGQDPLRTTLSVEARAPEGCAASVAPDAVVIRGAVPPERYLDAEVRIEAMLDCEEPPPTTGLVAPEPGPWLAVDEPGIPSTEHVHQLAREWARGHRQPIDQLRAIWDALEQHIRPAFLYPEDAELDPLELGWADCKTSSSLLVAMARALGIPARLVAGTLLVRDRPSDFHFWMEAWLPDRGWTPFDWLATVTLSELPDERDRWRYFFFGRLDYRLIHERFPRRAFAATGARLPASWYRVEYASDGGLVREYRAADDRAPVFIDTFEIEELTWQ